MTNDEIINFDPFIGDDAHLTCRKASIKKARKVHTCFNLAGDAHSINVGERYRHETACIDGEFFETYKICLSCIKNVSGL